MADSEEEIYSIMFSSLKHPVRRKILRMLSEEPMSFSQLLDALGVSSSHLTYHLESLGELLAKTEDGTYKLSSFGQASVATMKGVEEAPSIPKRHFFSFSLRWKTIFAALIIGIVLVASISVVEYNYLNQLSSGNERLQIDLESVQDENERLLAWSTPASIVLPILSDVIHLDMTKYKTSLLGDTVEYRSGFGNVIEETMRYSLTSDGSNIEVSLRLRNNHFSRYQLFIDEEGSSPIYSQPQPTNLLTASKDILQRYKSYTNESYLEDMISLLSSANILEGNGTILDHTKLTISTSGDTVEIMLLYIENGVDFAPKSVRLVFENQILRELLDGWFLFSIGNTEINFSQSEAIEIARNAAPDFTWNYNGVEVGNFTVLQQPVSVDFHPSPKNGLALVPYWFVTLYLDKTYPGGVSRLGVGVWADTGQVDSIITLT
jgi:predicted transcriptional regulator